MLSKLKTLVVMLVLLTIAAMPMALAQEVYWDDPSSPNTRWAYSPETGEWVYCDIVYMGSPVADICLANGIIPAVEWSVHPDGGIVSTATIAPGYTPEGTWEEILRRARLGQYY